MKITRFQDVPTSDPGHCVPITTACTVHGPRYFNPDCKYCLDLREEMTRIAQMLMRRADGKPEEK